MTKQEYLNALRRSLYGYPEDFRKDIIDAFEGHFLEGFAQGQTEEEIVENLGTVEEVMENIRMMNGEPASGKKEEDELRDNIDQFANSLKDTVISMTRLFTTGLDQASRIVRDLAEETEPRSRKSELNDTPVLKIKSENTDTDITIRPGNKLSYEFSPAMSLFSSSQAELTYKEETDCTTMYIRYGTAALELEVPESVRTIEIEARSGDMNIADIHTGTISIRTAAGDIQIVDSEADEITVNDISGDLTVHNVSAKYIRLTSTSGDIDLKDTAGDLSLRTVSGDIEIGGGSSGKIEAGTVSGDIDIDTECGMINASSLSGDILPPPSHKLRGGGFSAKNTSVFR